MTRQDLAAVHGIDERISGANLELGVRIAEDVITRGCPRRGSRAPKSQMRLATCSSQSRNSVRRHWQSRTRLKQWLPQAEFYGYEIEPEWADQARAAGCDAPPATAATCTTLTLRSTRSARARPTGTAWPITTRRARQPAPHLPARAGPAADPRQLRGAAMGRWHRRREYRAARGGLDRMPPRPEAGGNLRAERERPHSRRRAPRGLQLARRYIADARLCLHAPHARALPRPASRRQRPPARRLRVCHPTTERNAI